MATLEDASRKRAKRGSLERTALTVLATAGIVGLAIAAPKTLRLLHNVDPGWFNNNSSTRRLRNVARRLKAKGLIEWRKEQGRVRMKITAAGRAYLEHAMQVEKQPRPRKWDGKWRLVIFDIPESRKSLRNKIRDMVGRFGFVRLQNSVWAYPYDCEEVITLIKKDLSVGKELLYIIADAIEFEEPLKRKFQLR